MTFILAYSNCKKKTDVKKLTVGMSCLPFGVGIPNSICHPSSQRKKKEEPKKKNNNKAIELRSK